jgi:signal transduction histidine kinase
VRRLDPSRLGPAAVAAALAAGGGLLTLAIASGPLTAGELGHLAYLLGAAIVVTVVATAFASPLLGRASMRLRFVAIAVFATAVGLANLAALALLMVVSGHHAVQIAILLVYATAAAIGAALATARSSTAAVERLSATARRIADGDLDARVGRVGGGAELEALASTLDEMAERLRRSLERERAAQSQRRDLITAVSHDLRTPLSGLRAMVEAIDDGIVDEPETIGRYVREMRGAIDSLVRLVDDLFEIVQLDAGAIEAESRNACLEDVVASAVAACDAQAAEKGLVLETSIEQAGSARCSPRVTRVVQNLLQNAIRHTPADGSVTVRAEAGPEAVQIEVADTGDGISDEDRSRAFEPFYRGGGEAARDSEGAGLGLAICRAIVETHGGHIWIGPSEQGTRVRFSLPSAS